MKSLNIIQDHCRSPGIFSAKIWIREGSRADPYKKAGIHSLLLSLLSRGCGPYKNEEVAEIIEGSGAEFLCETYEDGLMLSLKCTKPESSILLTLLDYMLTEPHLDQSQINLERKLAIQSINRHKENPFNLAFIQWKKLAYYNHPYNNEALGNEKDLNSITRDDIKSLSTKLLDRHKTIILSGAIPKNAESCLCNIRSKSSNNLGIKDYSIPKILTKSRAKNEHRDSLAIHYQDTNQIVMIIGTLTTSHSNPDDLILRLIACHLGTGMSSLLFKKLREENGLTYDVGVYHPIRELEAPFMVHASSSKEKSVLALKLLKKCWEDIQNIDISQEELYLAKAKFKGNLAYNSQTISQRAERKVHLIGMNMNKNTDSYNLKRLNYITANELKECALKYFKQPILSISGPKENIDILSDLWIPS